MSQNNSIAVMSRFRNRLRVSEYFDGLVRELDLKVEHFIRDFKSDAHLVASANLQRERFIKEIRLCEAVNLQRLANTTPGQQDEGMINDVCDSDELSPSLFCTFCFFIELEDRIECYDEYGKSTVVKYRPLESSVGLRLIVCDSYLSKAQIKCFQELLNFLSHRTSIEVTELAQERLAKLFTYLGIQKVSLYCNLLFESMRKRKKQKER
jgi:hypothetical protein